MKTLAGIAVAALLCAALAACGASNATKVASGVHCFHFADGRSPYCVSPRRTAAMFRFVACVRDHGVPSFPEPVMVEYHGYRVPDLRIPSSLRGRRVVGRATDACKGILPATSF